MQYLHTMIRVSNLEETLHFFCDLLGMVEISRKSSDKGRFTLVFLAAPEDEARAREDRAPMIELTYNWDPEEYTGGRNFGHLAYRVDDIYALCEHLKANGVTINRPPGMAIWPLSARRITSRSSFCRRARHCHRKNPGPVWKTRVPGKPTGGPPQGLERDIVAVCNIAFASG